MACEFEPHVGLCAQSLEPPSDSVTPSLSATVSVMLSLSLSLSLKNKQTLKKRFDSNCKQKRQNACYCASHSLTVFCIY